MSMYTKQNFHFHFSVAYWAYYLICLILQLFAKVSMYLTLWSSWEGKDQVLFISTSPTILSTLPKILVKLIWVYYICYSDVYKSVLHILGFDLILDVFQLIQITKIV